MDHPIQSAQMSVDAFKKIVRDGVQAACKNQGWNENKENERGYAFQKWVGQLVIQREGLDANVDDGMFLSGDLMIDVALEDADRKLLYLIQTKYPSLAQSPPISEDEVVAFLDRHSVLYDHPDWVREHANDQLLEFVGDYRQKLKDGWGVYFYFVSTGRASPRITDLVNEKHSSIRRALSNVSFQLLDISGLKELYIQAQTLEQSIPEETRFLLRKDSWILKEAPHEALLTIVKGNTLAALYKKERERIFAYNIRSYLGRNQLNKDIIETAINKPEDFYYFNNGVSAICTSFEINKKTNEFVAENFQIINGAQTVGALASTPQLKTDVEVLLRVTKAGSVKTEKGFNADIIRYNNTQNVVKLSDFRANDQIHLWLEKKFAELRARGAIDQKLAYERKRSFKRYPGTYVIALEELAKIRFAFLFEPTRCVGDPKSLWTYSQDGGVYEQALGINGELPTFWPQEVFDETLLALITYKRIEELIDERVKKDRKFLWLRRLRYFALALAAEHLKITNQNGAELMESRATFVKWFDTFWKECSRALVDAYQQAFDVDKTTVFALARSDQRWATTRSKFATLLEMAL
jgi:AIPR protein